MKSFRFVLVCFMAWLWGAMVYAGDAKIFPVAGLFPMTGPQAYYGRVMSRGSEMAIEHLNKPGGVEGYKFKLKIIDFQNINPMLAITGVQKMFITRKASFLLTSFSAITLAVQPVCAAGNVVMINGGAYSPELLSKPYLHTIRLSQVQMVPPMLTYLWETGARRLAVIYTADPGGEIPAKDFVKPLWIKMGGEIVADEPHKPGLTDYKPFISRIKAGNPDAIYDISTGQDQAFIVKQIREAGLDVPMCVSDWSDDFNAIAGKTSENVYMSNDYFDRTHPDPMTQQFVKDYEAEFKEPPDFYAANYYDAVYNILAELIRRVIKAGGNPLDGADLENAIWTDPVFNTVYGGKMKLNKDGSSEKPMVIFKLVDGKKVVEKYVTLNR